MKFDQRWQLSRIALCSLVTLTSAAAFAQAIPGKPTLPTGALVQERPTDPRGGACHCSNPINVHILKNSGPTSGIAGEFRPDMRLNQQSYNATSPNTHFTETLRWKMPDSKTCEYNGKLVIKLKNLGTSLSSNDSAGVFEKGVAVPGFSQGVGTLWTAGQGAGALKTVSYQLTAQMMQRGQLSYFVQDDTAVLEIKLDIEGCCITPTK